MKKIIYISFALFSCLFSTISVAQVFSCREDEVLVWPIRIGNPPYQHFSTPEAMCENWPDDHVVFWHGQGWVYHSTNVNDFRNGANCLYTNNGPGFSGQPRELSIGGFPLCLDRPSLGGEDAGYSCNLSPNPCNVATGNKFREEIDFQSESLSFIRFYNSQAGVGRLDMGGWSHSYIKRLDLSVVNWVSVVSNSGRSESFRWLRQFVWLGEDDSDFILQQDENGFTLVLPSGAIDRYSTDGNILSETDTPWFREPSFVI